MELFLSIIILLGVGFLIYRSLKADRKKSFSAKIYVDTSTLIDGRILEVAKTGFIMADLVIPRSVLRELQLLADSGDSEKRARARFGLDIVRELERVIEVNVDILDDELNGTKVDDRLIDLAKLTKGVILTNDFNLNKVAVAEKIQVLNINDLSLALRAEYRAGEKTIVKITAKGNNKNQGVGYLKDGTMVVVESASNKIGQEIEIEIVNFVQTSAGKMAFAKIPDLVKSALKVNSPAKAASTPKPEKQTNNQNRQSIQSTRRSFKPRRQQNNSK
jgi:uncharacterized protein YacL